MRLAGSLFLVFFIHTALIGQDREQIITVNGYLENLSLKGVSLDPFYQVSKDFSELDVFGKPNRIDSIIRFSEAKWTFIYPDFIITFVQWHPIGPELLDIEVLNQSAEFS